MDMDHKIIQKKTCLETLSSLNQTLCFNGEESFGAKNKSKNFKYLL